MAAANRRQAQQGLLDMETMFGAMAACWSKDGQRAAEKIRSGLLKQLQQ
jgi:hypothetical protein